MHKILHKEKLFHMKKINYIYIFKNDTHFEKSSLKIIIGFIRMVLIQKSILMICIIIKQKFQISNCKEFSF